MKIEIPELNFYAPASLREFGISHWPETDQEEYKQRVRDHLKILVPIIEESLDYQSAEVQEKFLEKIQYLWTMYEHIVPYYDALSLSHQGSWADRMLNRQLDSIRKLLSPIGINYDQFFNPFFGNYSDGERVWRKVRAQGPKD